MPLLLPADTPLSPPAAGGCRYRSGNAGRWRLSPSGAERTTAAAELACDVSALGSVYLGGFTFEQLRWGERLEELKPGAVARADELFRTERLPWCPELF